MLIRVNTTQMTEIGMFRSGVAYNFDKKNPAHMATAQHILDNGFGEETTRKKLDMEKQRLERAGAARDGDVPPVAGGNPASAATDATGEGDDGNGAA